jgi:hypothetical protein
MIKLLLEVPPTFWFLMLIGFAVHVLMKLDKHITKGCTVKSFFTVKTLISMVISLLMSTGMIIAGNDSFKGNDLLAFGALGAGYLNNSLFTNLMQMFKARVNKAKTDEE